MMLINFSFKLHVRVCTVDTTVVLTLVCYLYSRAPDGNRNWRYRAVDLSVTIHGHPDMLRELKTTLEGALPR